MSVGVIFGGKSCEHDISIITGVQTLNVLQTAGYDVVPIYIDGGGVWYTGKEMNAVTEFESVNFKIRKKWIPARLEPCSSSLVGPKGKVIRNLNCIVVCTHGVGGEDGCLQGLLQLTGIPYTGCGVLASAVGMDKDVMKRLFKDAGLPLLPYEVISGKDAVTKPDNLLKIAGKLTYPVIVKPANLGSSIGIGIANNDKELIEAARVASVYDRKLVIEKALVNFTELNCAVLGRGTDLIASGVEQPVGWKEFLTFEDKYMDPAVKSDKGVRIKPPAQIADTLKNKVKKLAKKAFESIGASGVARIDFLMDGDKLYVNEINTIPGSLSFYLFEYDGMSHVELLGRLIRIAKEEQAERNALTYSYKSDVLRSVGGKNRK